MDGFLEARQNELNKELVIKFEQGETDFDFIVIEFEECSDIEEQVKSLLDKGFNIEDYLDGVRDRFSIEISGKTTLLKNLRELMVHIDIQRYKGLGEMNPEQLWESTMNPETRILYKVRIEDGVEADRIFTILMGTEVEARRDFIEKYSLEVKNLDV